MPPFERGTPCSLRAGAPCLPRSLVYRAVRPPPNVAHCPSSARLTSPRPLRALRGRNQDPRDEQQRPPDPRRPRSVSAEHCHRSCRRRYRAAVHHREDLDCRWRSAEPTLRTSPGSPEKLPAGLCEQPHQTHRLPHCRPGKPFERNLTNRPKHHRREGMVGRTGVGLPGLVRA
jgi:hypothetical protein